MRYFCGGELVPRPEIYPVKKLVGLSESMLEAIDKWRRKQRPVPNVSDAIRYLIEAGLKSARPMGKDRE
jgi:Arc/MetJ-type ribon-helix-helix transcriptional regulator